MRLTDLAVKKFKPGPKPVKHSDGQGLYIEIPCSGNPRWRYSYDFNNKRKLLALGTYPDVTLAEARRKHQTARELVLQGTDPMQQRKVQKEIERVAERDTFMAVALEWHGNKSREWADGYAERVMGRLKANLFMPLGDRHIASITAPELLEVLRVTEARGGGTAKKLLQYCGAIMRYGIATGRCLTDVSGGLKGALIPVVEGHHPAITAPKELGPFLKRAWDYWGSPTVTAALKLTVLLPVRQGELCKAEWSEIDLENGLWEIPASRMKMNEPHIVPLSEQAVAILRALHPFTGRKRYVFPSSKYPDTKVISSNAVRSAMRKMGYGNDIVVPHGFRATFRTIGAEIFGFREDLLEQQLAHAVRDTNGRAYNRTKFLPERKKMMQDWSDYLDQLRIGERSR